MADIARKTALDILNTVSLKNNYTLDRIITDKIDNAALKLSSRDRNFVNALIFGVLRWQERLDWQIRHYSKISFNKIKPEILNVLRLGLYQCFF